MASERSTSSIFRLVLSSYRCSPARRARLSYGQMNAWRLVDVIQPVRVIDFVADVPQVRARGELMEGDFVADSPVADGEAVIGVP